MAHDGAPSGSVVQPREYLNKLPDSFESTDRILVSDPMLATGGTIVAVLQDIMRRGGNPDLVRVLAITAAPPALKLLSENFPGAASAHSFQPADIAD